MSNAQARVTQLPREPSCEKGTGARVPACEKGTGARVPAWKETLDDDLTRYAVRQQGGRPGAAARELSGVSGHLGYGGGKADAGGSAAEGEPQPDGGLPQERGQ